MRTNLTAGFDKILTWCRDFLACIYLVHLLIIVSIEFITLNPFSHAWYVQTLWNPVLVAMNVADMWERDN